LLVYHIVAVKNGMETPATHFDTGYPGIDTGYPDSTGFLTLATGYTANPGYLTLATPDLIPLENSTSNTPLALCVVAG
jgi:hypothetical protein